MGLDGMGWIDGRLPNIKGLLRAPAVLIRNLKKKMKPKNILLKVNTKEISWDPALLLARNSSIAVLKFKIELKSVMVKMMKMCACLIANDNLDNHVVMMIVAYVINI